MQPLSNDWKFNTNGRRSSELMFPNSFREIAKNYIKKKMLNNHFRVHLGGNKIYY